MNTETIHPRILKGRKQLCANPKSAFWGTLIMYLQPVADSGCDTMATDGARLFYNPEYVDSLSEQELLGVLVHEVEHPARRHHTRINGRDLERWNRAADYSINPDILAAGFKLPEGALVDPRFFNLNADQIYRILEREESQQQQQQQPESGDGAGDDETDSDQSGDDAGDDNGGDDSGADDSGDESGDGAGDDAGDDSDNSGNGSGGDDAGDDSDSDNSGDGSGNGGDDAGDDAGDGNGNGAGDDSDSGNGAGNESGQGDSDQSGQGNGNGAPQGNGNGGQGNESKAPSIKPDPGRCGGVLPAAKDHQGAELADMESEWSARVRQAAAVAKRTIGTLPGGISNLVAELNRPQLDARELFRRFIDESNTKDYSWTQPSRRHMSQGFTLPGFVPDRPSHVVMLLDTSCSISDSEIGFFISEGQNALDSGAADKVTLGLVTTELYSVREYLPGDTIEKTGFQRGGTSFTQPLQWIAENIPDATAILFLTDLACYDFAEEPGVPLIWIVTGNPNDARQWIEKAPYGESIILEDCSY